MNFWLEKQVDIWILKSADGGCQPASETEIALWRLLTEGITK